MQALARSLFRRAQGTLGTLPADSHARALAALDAFLAGPGPARYLAAVRVLAAEERTAARHRLERGGAGRAFADAVLALEASGLDAETVRLLTDRPAAPGLGVRLEALAALVTAHRELAGRAEAATQALRRKLTARRKR